MADEATLATVKEILTNKKCLHPKELIFLRKAVGSTRAEFAAHLGVAGMYLAYYEERPQGIDAYLSLFVKSIVSNMLGLGLRVRDIHPDFTVSKDVSKI